MRQKYSGSTASSAPAAAACASSARAASRLAGTPVPETVCSAAIFMTAPSTGGSFGRRAGGAGRGGRVALDAGHARIGPGAVDVELLGGGLHEGLAQEHLC